MAIDRKRIIESLSRVKATPTEQGLIPAFNVYVNQFPTALWNSFAERLTRNVGANLLPVAEDLLVNAAHECGYHTGYGIITSEEWAAVVGPMIERNPEDVLYGAFAVFTAWGWAKADIAELEPCKRMVVRAYDYYEADSTVYGATSKPSAYMIRGVCAAFMDLAYGGPYDPTGKTGLNSFHCAQTKGIECGDDYGEFVVTASSFV
ncbi:MAG TPA: hypothetical protein VMB34_22285 [Acetobacteraceae bacterium]|nr:hypothetical protein [Acetobacteraceae bacterium]